MEKAIAVIEAHIPSMTDADELLVERDRYDGAIDPADLVRRTCPCGLRIYGIYQYIDHLTNELRKAAADG